MAKKKINIRQLRKRTYEDAWLDGMLSVIDLVRKRASPKRIISRMHRDCKKYLTKKV